MARIYSVRIKLQISYNYHNFICCEFLTMDSRLCNGAAVAVGAIFSDGSSCCYDRAWQRCVAAAIEENEVRYIAGVFLPPKKAEVDKLFKALHVREGHMLFQPFWTEDKCIDEDIAAVADRFDVLPANARYIAVYPAYVLIRGSCNELSVPAIREQPGGLVRSALAGAR